MNYFDLTRGSTDRLQPVKTFDQVALEKPPKVRFPDREYTYVERLPENSVFQEAVADLSGLGLFDDLAEQDARLEQNRAQQVMRRRLGGVMQPRQEPPDLAWLHQQAGDMARIAAQRAAEEVAQHVVRAGQRDQEMMRMMQQVLQQGQVPQPQFAGQGPPPRQRTRAAVAAVTSQTQTEQREWRQDAPTQTEDARVFRRARGSQTEGRAAGEMGTQTDPRDEGMYGPMRDRGNPWSGRGHRLRSEEPHRRYGNSLGTQTEAPATDGIATQTDMLEAPVRRRRLEADTPADVARQAAIHAIGWYDVSQAPTVTVGHQDMSTAAAPLVPHVPQIFSIADEDVGDDIVVDDDELERGPGRRRPGDGEASQARRRRTETPTDIVPFDPARGAQVSLFDPTAIVAYEDRGRTEERGRRNASRSRDESNERRRERRRRDRELRRAVRGGQMTADAALDQAIRNHQADQRSRRAGAHPPAFR